MSKDGRYYSWSLITYPDDSEPVNVFELVKEMTYACILHDKDLNPDGSTKKKHRHWVFTFEGKKSYEQVMEYFEPLHGARPEPCRTVKGSIRYFLHKDNPEKQPYDRLSIIDHGLDIDSFLLPTKSEISQKLLYIMKVIKLKHISDYLSLQEEFSDNMDILYIIQTNVNWAVNTCKGEFLRQAKKERNDKTFAINEDGEIDTCIKK